MDWGSSTTNMRSTRTTAAHLLVFDHHFEPLFEVFLHTDTATFKQVLDALNLCLEVLKLSIL